MYWFSASECKLRHYGDKIPAVFTSLTAHSAWKSGAAGFGVPGRMVYMAYIRRWSRPALLRPYRAVIQLRTTLTRRVAPGWDTSPFQGEEYSAPKGHGTPTPGSAPLPLS